MSKTLAEGSPPHFMHSLMYNASQIFRFCPHMQPRLVSVAIQLYADLDKFANLFFEAHVCRDDIARVRMGAKSIKKGRAERKAVVMQGSQN